jgi:hypothetical protein
MVTDAIRLCVVIGLLSFCHALAFDLEDLNNVLDENSFGLCGPAVMVDSVGIVHAAYIDHGLLQYVRYNAIGDRVFTPVALEPATHLVKERIGLGLLPNGGALVLWNYMHSPLSYAHIDASGNLVASDTLAGQYGHPIVFEASDGNPVLWNATSGDDLDPGAMLPVLYEHEESKLYSLPRSIGYSQRLSFAGGTPLMLDDSLVLIPTYRWKKSGPYKQETGLTYDNLWIFKFNVNAGQITDSLVISLSEDGDCVEAGFSIDRARMIQADQRVILLARYDSSRSDSRTKVYELTRDMKIISHPALVVESIQPDAETPIHLGSQTLSWIPDWSVEPATTVRLVTLMSDTLYHFTLGGGSSDR